MQPTPALHAGGRKQGRLAHGIEGQREQRADQGYAPRMGNPSEAAQPAPPQADRAHNVLLSGGKHRAQVEQAENGQEYDRHPGAGKLEPRRRSPALRQQARAQRDQHDYSTMTNRKQDAAEARPTRVRMRVETGQAVNGCKMVGVETVFQAEHESQQDKGEAIARRRRHGRRRDARIKGSF